MKSNKRQRRRLMAEINVVPYIDVMLVLLVIFMITTPLLTQGVQVNLPEAQASAIPPEEEEPLIISVDSLGRYYLNVASKPEQAISREELSTQVAARLRYASERHKTLSVLVKGDRTVNYGAVVQAMVLLQQAGAAQVGLMTSPTEATG